ncbi:serine hydrolase domain-containing protein [Nocardia thraciensis]
MTFHSIISRRPRSWRLLAVVLVSALAVTTAACASPDNEAARSAQPDWLTRDLDALVALGITGAQTRVIDQNGAQLTATSGVADIDTKRPVSPDGHFRMGSTTKTFTATVVLQLVGEGLLSLEDSVEKWLPGVVRGNGNDGAQITIRELLQHTSGISDESYPMPRSGPEYLQMRFHPTPSEQIVADAMRHRPLFEPGNGWSYANTGYVLLGMVIQKVTGRPWHKEVAARIIEPLRLTHTLWPGYSPDLPEPHARAYLRSAPGEPFVDVTQLINVDASGGLITTTEDLNRFLQALLGGQLLQPTELTQMKQTVPTDESVQRAFPGARYGLGIMNVPLSCGGSYWTNSGSDPGWGNDNGVTADGRRSVVTSWSTEDITDPERSIKQARTFVKLTQDALCLN